MKSNILHMIKNILKMIAVILTVVAVSLVPFVLVWTWMEQVPIFAALIIIVIWSVFPICLCYILAFKFLRAQNKKQIILPSILLFVLGIIMFFIFDGIPRNLNIVFILPFMPVVAVLDCVVPQSFTMVLVWSAEIIAMSIGSLRTKDKSQGDGSVDTEHKG